MRFWYQRMWLHFCPQKPQCSIRLTDHVKTHINHWRLATKSLFFLSTEGNIQLHLETQHKRHFKLYRTFCLKAWRFKFVRLLRNKWCGQKRTRELNHDAMEEMMVKILLLFTFCVCTFEVVNSEVEITILHTNDIHAHFEEMETRDGEKFGGIARRKAKVRNSQRRQAFYCSRRVAPWTFWRCFPGDRYGYAVLAFSCSDDNQIVGTCCW